MIPEPRKPAKPKPEQLTDLEMATAIVKRWAHGKALSKKSLEQPKALIVGVLRMKGEQP